jgi:chromosome segregation ATPase
MECSAQIGTLGEYLRNSNDYLSNVKSLNEKLDASEQRTKTIEEMAAFFKKEILQIEQRKDAITKTVGTVDSILEEKLRKLAEHAGDNVAQFNKAVGTVGGILEEKLRQLAENADENVKQFYKALGEQQDALQKKLNETSIIVGELKNLSAIKESISKFERATNDQNKKIDNLATAIQSLAKAQAKTGGTITEIPMPIKKKILIWTSSAVGGLLLLFLIIANWKHIAKIIDLFEM